MIGIFFWFVFPKPMFMSHETFAKFFFGSMSDITLMNICIRLSVVLLHASSFIIRSVCCAAATTAKAGYAEQKNFVELLLCNRLKRMNDEN
jgi:hypothetical protein